MNRLAIISKERIQEELLKGLSGDNPSVYFERLEETGLLRTIFPEFNGANCTFHDSRGHHNGESVFEHTRLALLRAGAMKPTLRLALMLHDVGKMFTGEFKDGKTMFRKHEEVGAALMNFRLEQLKFSNADRSYVVRLIQNHMQPHDIDLMEQTNPRRVRRCAARLFVALKENTSFLFDLCALAEADSGKTRETTALKALVTEFSTTPKAITGEDTMDAPKEIRGQLLDRLRIIQLTQRKTRDAMLREHLESETNNLAKGKSR